jgi:hypothetical protein
MCSTCSEGRKGILCPACRLSLGTWPYSRGDYDFSRVWNSVFEAWRRDIVMLGVAGLVMVGLASVGQVVTQVFSLVGQALLVGGGKSNVVAGAIVMGMGVMAGVGVTIVVQGIGIMGLTRVGIDSLLGRKVEIPRMFSQARKVWRYAAVQLALFFGVGVPFLAGLGLIFAAAVLVGGGTFSSSGVEQAFKGTAAFFVLGLGVLALTFAMTWALLPFVWAPFELVYGDCDAIEALRRAWTLGHGHRAQTFGYLFVGALVVMALAIAGFLALCVGAFIAIPIGYALFYMVQAGLYLSLRNGSGLPPPVES